MAPLQRQAPVNALRRFAAHLGFPTPDAPFFDAIVAGADPVDHIAFAAAQGFGGVSDPFAAMRSGAAQARIGQAAADRALSMGSFLYLPFDKVARARWATRDPDARAQVQADVREAIAVAGRLGSRQIAVLGLAEARMPTEQQQIVMADTLRAAGDRVGAAGLELCVEGVNPQRLPQCLLHGIAAAAEVVRRAAHPAVRLLFDTGHAAAVGEDVGAMLALHHDIVGAIQIADHPGRVEMGGGALDFGAFLAEATERGYAGLYELEHRWSRPGAGIQRDYLDRIRGAFDLPRKIES